MTHAGPRPLAIAGLISLIFFASTGGPVVAQAPPPDEVAAIRGELEELNVSLKQLLLLLNERFAHERRSDLVTQITALDEHIAGLENTLAGVEGEILANRETLTSVARETESTEANLRSDGGLADVMERQFRSNLRALEAKRADLEAAQIGLQRRADDLRRTIDARRALRGEVLDEMDGR